jgi:hypothetical protein
MISTLKARLSAVLSWNYGMEDWYRGMVHLPGWGCNDGWWEEHWICELGAATWPWCHLEEHLQTMVNWLVGLAKQFKVAGILKWYQSIWAAIINVLLLHLQGNKLFFLLKNTCKSWGYTFNVFKISDSPQFRWLIGVVIFDFVTKMTVYLNANRFLAPVNSIVSC